MTKVQWIRNGVAAAALLALGSPACLQAGGSVAHAAGVKPLVPPETFHRLIQLPGSRLPALQGARAMGAISGAQSMSVAVVFHVQHEAALRQLIQDQYDRTSPLFHRFLTPQQFAARFAPSAAQRGVVAAWLQSRHLHVVQRTRNGLQITVRGTAAQMEAAFGTRLQRYSRGTRRFFANSSPVHVPAALAGSIQAVSGLSNFGRFAPDRTVPHTTGRRRDVRLRQTSDVGLTPSNLAQLYDTQAFSQHSVSGQGQTIALVEFHDFQAANIAAYDAHFGISAGPVQRVAVSDGQNTGAKLDNGESESELDIEVVHAMAPSAKVEVYEAPNSTLGSIAMWNQIVSDNTAGVISTSNSSPEWDYYPFEIWATNAALEEAAVQGQTVFTSTGDYGAFSDPTDHSHLSVRFPGSSPWVTSVGGTTLEQNSDGTVSEVAWSDSSDATQPAGGGGGLSLVFKRPDWQVGPGVQTSQSNGMRQMPDVSAVAGTPYATYISDNGAPGKWQGVGGTSAAAPLWAAYGLLLDQALNTHIGFFNPTLYKLGATTFQHPAFYDITQGDNLYYKATRNWDFASGWGSFDGAAMLADLQQTGLVSYPAPSVIYAVSNNVGKKSGSRLVAVSKVKRGATIYLVTFVDINRLPGATAGKLHVVLAKVTGKKTLLNKTQAVQYTASQVGKEVTRTLKFKVPKSAPKGKYVFESTLTMGVDVEFDDTGITVQ